MEEMKIGRVRKSEAFLAMICRRSKAMLDSNVTMDESAVSFHSPEMKQQSKHEAAVKTVAEEGRTWPHQGRSSCDEGKTEVLAFFDSKASFAPTTCLGVPL
jgi:hypothetical protein